jgi:hypothetical protein
MMETCWNFVIKLHFFLFQMIKTSESQRPESQMSVAFPPIWISTKKRKIESGWRRACSEMLQLKLWLLGNQDHPGDAFSKHLPPPSFRLSLLWKLVFIQVGFKFLTAVSTNIALMMEAARTSETLVNFYQTTRRYNPEDSHLRTYAAQCFRVNCLHIRIWECDRKMFFS